jgi:hypothetical protein
LKNKLKYKKRNKFFIGQFKLVSLMSKQSENLGFDINFEQEDSGNSFSNFKEIGIVKKINEFFLMELLDQGPSSMIWEGNYNHSGIFANLGGSIFHFYVENYKWFSEVILHFCSGDISSIYEPSRGHSAFFSKSSLGFLRYTFFNGEEWQTIEKEFKEAGKMIGRICAIFEERRNSSSCFSVGEDRKIHYFYMENCKWMHKKFGEFPCSGDLSAAYDIERQSPTFIYDSYGKLYHYYYEQKEWKFNSKSFTHLCCGIISVVYEKQNKHISVFYEIEDGKIVYYTFMNGWKSEFQQFKHQIIGDLTSIYNEETKHSEVIYRTKCAIEHYFKNESNEWVSNHHIVDCFSKISAIYQPNRKSVEFFFFSYNKQRNYLYCKDGKKYQNLTNLQVKCWNP